MTGRSLLETVIARAPEFSVEHARYVLSLGFAEEEQRRYEELAYRAQGSEMTPTERQELDEFLRVNALLSLLKAKARLMLKGQSSAA